MTLKKPALDPMTLAARTSSGYPEPYRSRVLPREKRALGDPLGLTKIGINHTTLPPGKESSMRHWHTHEDEFIFVLSGEVVVITEAGEQVLGAGMCAGFPASADGRTGDGHQLVNRGTLTARLLTVGARSDEDFCEYSDIDLRLTAGRYSGRARFTHKDGTPY